MSIIGKPVFVQELSRRRGLVAVILVFTSLLIIIDLLSQTPLGYFDISYMSSGGAALALAAIGQSLVILTGGFDLSVGAVISLVNVVLAMHLQPTLGSECLWVVIGIGLGACVGALNGVFVAWLRLQPIVVTLAVMFITQGITLLVTDKPGGNVPANFASFFTGSAIPGWLPAPLVVIGLVLIIWRLIKQTRFGTAIYAVGSDADAARHTGIRVSKTIFLTYVLAGAAYGIAGVMITAQTSTGDPLVGNPLLLQIFTAVVIGGTVLGGGRGGALGPVFGAYVLMFIVNILLVLNVPAYYSTVVQGLILILAAFCGVANSRLPLVRWLVKPYLPILWARRQAAEHPLKDTANHVHGPLAQVTWYRRHAETLRYSLPAYICFFVVFLVTISLFGNFGFHYLGALAVLSSFLIVLALGQGTVILTGGLDLSLPWTIGLAGILISGLAQGHPDAVIWTIPFVLLVGAAIGATNGAGVVLLGLPPIVVTLGMDGILQGVSLLYSGGTPSGFAPGAIRWVMTGHFLALTPIVWLILLFILGARLLLSRTGFGRCVYAIGNSPRVARLSGVHVGRMTIAVYSLSGICSALVGIMLAGFSGQASLGMGNDYLLPSIAVVVVGGTLITGGRGHYLGMVGGVLLLTALQTLLTGTLAPPAIRQILYGSVVLAAIVALRERQPS